MLDWLKPIMGDSHTVEIEAKIEAEIGKHFISRADFNLANEAKKTLETALAERDEQIETLKTAEGVTKDLKKTIEDLQDASKAKDTEHGGDVFWRPVL